MPTTIAITNATPVVVPPSGRFDGNDGPWSTFNIHVGTPPQPVRVLVSFNVGETWVISANKTQGGCLATDPPGCAQARGGLFRTDLSTTWQDEGEYNLIIEQNLDSYSGSGDYGFDVMGLGLADSGGIRLDFQTITAISTKDFYLGNLGVNSQRTNLTSLENGAVSFLESMKSTGNIPSLSYAYSAGAQYRNATLGTLTLGGYDSTRALTNPLSFSMAEDIRRDLVISLESISSSDTTGKTVTLSSKQFFAFIDATVPEIWLPQEVCSKFESAFGLIYNSTIKRYLINDTLHNILQEQNPSVSFLLSDRTRETTTVNITLPYASFDLELRPPFDDITHNYFPLRQATNNTQYTLGRAFLQESYLIVDYERQNFSVSQNDWYGDTSPQIVTISPIAIPNAVNGTSTFNGKVGGSHRPPPGTLAATGVAAFFACIIATAAGAFFFNRRRRRSREKMLKDPKIEETIDAFAKAEMDGSGKDPLAELDAPWKSPVEADSSSRIEMPGNLGERRELVGSRVSLEMEGSNAAAEDRFGLVEMDAGTHGLLEAPSLSPRTLKSDTSTQKKDERRKRPSGKRKPLAKLPTSD